MKITAVLIAVALLAGCQNSATSTTQPSATSLVTITTEAEASLDVAVNAIHIAVAAGLISGADYWKNVDPYIQTALATVTTMEADAKAGDVSGTQAAADAIYAAVAKIAPYVAKSPTTKGT